MIAAISKILKKKLSKKNYNLIKKIYNFKTRNYDLSADLKHNENIFKILKFDIEKIKIRLSKLEYSYTSENLSWHYHLFAGLKDHFKDKKIKILEIGTFEGEFTNFISNIYEDSEIDTIDLDDNDKLFLNSYGRNDKSNFDKFLKLRSKNLSRHNINFYKFNSINIKKYFSEKKFDLIWVDGDHLKPQVIIDIINCLDLMKEDGILCTDDVIKSYKFEKMNPEFKKNLNVSRDGFITLNHFEINNVLKNYYFVKRINKKNFYLKKYVSLSIFRKNKIIVN